MNILSSRAVRLGLVLLLGCLVLGLITTLPSAASDVKLTNVSAPLKDYAELRFALPSNVTVETEALNEFNYSAGRVLRASLLLNQSRVTLHLLYPCQAPQTALEPSDMKSLLEGYNSAMKQANYSSELLSVGGMPALGGMVANQIFVAYQPSNRTPALIVMDGSMDEEVLVGFLQYLRIVVNDASTPLTPGYCPDTTSAAPQDNTNTNTNTNTTEISQVTSQTTPAEARTDRMGSAKEKMAADMEAAQKKLAQARERMK